MTVNPVHERIARAYHAAATSQAWEAERDALTARVGAHLAGVPDSDPLFAAVATALGCGKERWNVKTGTDADAAGVNMTPQPATIAELVAFAAPPPDPPARVKGGPEFQVYTIEATITAAKIEQDSDVHLALTDDAGNTMIAEVPCPGCCAGSPWLAQITAARSATETAIPGLGEAYRDVNRKATIVGPGLFDRIHGQRGVAPSGIEIHPVLAIEFAEGGAA